MGYVFFYFLCRMLSLQIIGTQRSGSNMLRLMLNQVPQIAAPHPPHILQVFFPLLPIYGDLEIAANFHLLATDISEYVKANPVSWEMDTLDASLLISRCRSHSLIEINKAVYELYAEQHGAAIWCCKSMASLDYIPQIEAAGVNPIYIHLVRDGRDVAASFRKAIVGEKHIYHLARQWKKDQETSEKYSMEHAPDRYIRVSYEDLIHDTENTIKKLLEHLNLHYDREVLEFYKTAEAKHTAEAGKMWNNVTHPVMTHNSNKFLRQLSEEDIALFESIAGDTLEHFGYKLHADKSAYVSSFSAEQIAAFDELNKKMKEEAVSKLDPKGSEKRKAQEAIVAKIKARKIIVSGN
jgi:hypothetical protein